MGMAIQNGLRASRQKAYLIMKSENNLPYLFVKNIRYPISPKKRGLKSPFLENHLYRR